MDMTNRIDRATIKRLAEARSLDRMLAGRSKEEEGAAVCRLDEDTYLLMSLADVVLSMLEMEEELPADILEKHKARLDRVVGLFANMVNLKIN